MIKKNVEETSARLPTVIKTKQAGQRHPGGIMVSLQHPKCRFSSGGLKSKETCTVLSDAAPNVDVPDFVFVCVQDKVNGTVRDKAH